MRGGVDREYVFSLTIVVITRDKNFPILTHEDRMLIARTNTHNTLSFQKTDFRERFPQCTVTLSQFPISVLSTRPNVGFGCDQRSVGGTTRGRACQEGGIGVGGAVVGVVAGGGVGGGGVHRPACGDRGCGERVGGERVCVENGMRIYVTRYFR